MISGATQSGFHFLLPKLRLPKSVAIEFDPKHLLNDPRPVRILWAHYSYDQPIFLDTDWSKITHVVCVSHWQKENFIRCFSIPPEKISVIRNGGADYFTFSPNKTKTLIYASTPYRGLEYLPEIFEQVLIKHPDCRLKVFSGMKLYGLEDEPEHRAIYEKLKNMPNVYYSEPIDHKLLAREFQQAAIFAYPNTWEETSCVTLIEALRSGTYPILSDLGALPETAGNYGTIVPMTGIYRSIGWLPDHEFIDNFSQAIIDALDNYSKFDLQSMSQHASAYYNWNSIAREWQTLIDHLHNQHVANYNKYSGSMFILR